MRIYRGDLPPGVALWLQYRNGEPMPFTGHIEDMPLQWHSVFEFCLAIDRELEREQAETEKITALHQAHIDRMRRERKEEGW